jgi:hypothetical protein
VGYDFTHIFSSFIFQICLGFLVFFSVYVVLSSEMARHDLAGVPQILNASVSLRMKIYGGKPNDLGEETGTGQASCEELGQPFHAVPDSAETQAPHS